MSLTYITDLRNGARFTKKERQRKCNIAEVSPDWGMTPSSLPLVFAERHLIGTAPTYTEVDGTASSAKFNGQVRDWARDNGYDIMPDGERLVVWESRDLRQKSYALNMAEPKVALGFVDLLLSWFSWAHGWKADYFTSLGWIAEEQGKPYTQDHVFWTLWDSGLILAAEAMTAAGKLVVAQQFKLTRPVEATNGLYMEEYPTRSGMTLYDHERDKAVLMRNGKEPVWTMEVRYPNLVPFPTLTLWKEWAERNGMYASIGRDATAQGAS